MTTEHPKISVIIPAHNSEHVLDACLAGLKKSDLGFWEIIVVDDASTDFTAQVALHFGATVISLPANHHASHCRNLGASHATGDILLFLDSDVVVQTNTVRHAVESLSDPGVDAVVGLYSAHHPHRGIASQYKNLWIRYSYLKSRQSVDWIFGAVAAIRAKTFRRLGGFDRTLFMHKGGDLELGKRMANMQPSIVLNPLMEVEHLKRHTLATLLRNDFERSQGFVQLAARLGQFGRSLTRGFVNVYAAFAYSSVIAWVILLAAVGSIWVVPFRWIAVLLLAGYIAVNAPFLLYYARNRSVVEAPVTLGIMFLDHLVCGLGSLRGLLRFLFSR